MSTWKRYRVFSAGVLALAVSFCFFNFGVARIYGQAATATVQGTVTDASGAAVPDAKVTIKNAGNGATVNSVTNAQGRFVVSNLNPGAQRGHS
jgi:hypothetical protein